MKCFRISRTHFVNTLTLQRLKQTFNVMVQELIRISRLNVPHSIAPVYAQGLLRRIEEHTVSNAMCESFLRHFYEEYPQYKNEEF